MRSDTKLGFQLGDFRLELGNCGSLGSGGGNVSGRLVTNLVGDASLTCGCHILDILEEGALVHPKRRGHPCLLPSLPFLVGDVVKMLWWRVVRR